MTISIRRKVICHTFAAVFAGLFVVPATWQIMDRRPAFLLTNSETSPPIISPGQPYRLIWDVQTIMPGCDVIGYRVVIDSAGNPNPTTPIPRAIFGDYDYWKVTRSAGTERILQATVPEGPAIIKTWAESKCTLFQKWFDWPVRQDYPDIHTEVRKG